MQRNGLGCVRLRRPWNFAWFTDGGDNRVDHAAGVGEAEVVVTGDGEYVVTSNIEAARLREEQTPDIEVLEYDWFAGPARLLDELAGGRRAGSDVPSPGAADFAEAIAPLRYRLDDLAADRYRHVGADTTAALAAAAGALDGDQTETGAAAALTWECRRRGLFTPVVLAGGAARLARHRHPVPANDRLGPRCLLVVCAERHGLYANVSRVVHFDAPDRQTTRRQAACQDVLEGLRQATRPGRTLADVFDDCRALYAKVGFPDEWRNHHQGGLTGYRSREVIAGPAVDLVIEEGQAFAWNPSVTGAKAEETFLLTAAGPQLIT